MSEDEFSVRPYIIEEFLLKHNKKLGNFDIHKSITLETIIYNSDKDNDEEKTLRLFKLFPEYKHLYVLSKKDAYSIGEVVVNLNLPLKTVLIIISNMVEMKLISINSNNNNETTGKFRHILDRGVVKTLIQNIKAL